MIQNNTAYRVLQTFFDSPTTHFQLREISRNLDLGLPSVRNHVMKLEKWGFVKKEAAGAYNSFVSSGSDVFKLHKRNDALVRLHESGLVGFIADKFVPDAISLFGSAARGEDVENSDIDLLVVSSGKDVDLARFEKKLKRRIALHFEPIVSEIPKELMNNVINGIVLYGYLKVL